MLQVENISIKKCYSGWHKEPGNFFAAATGAIFPFFLQIPTPPTPEGQGSELIQPK